MRRFLSWMLAMALLISVAGASLSAARRITGRTAAATPLPLDEIALLPASDLIAVVDVKRLVNEVWPQIKSAGPADLAKAAKEMDDLTAQTGTDLTKLKTVIVGAKLNGEKGSGVMIFQGLSFDLKRIEATVKSKNGEFKTTDYKGRQVISVKVKAASQVAAAAASAGVPFDPGDEVNFAAIDGQTVVMGDVSSIKGVLDASAGTGRDATNAGLTAAMKDAKATGLIRFAANLPESLRRDLNSQGDLFTQIAAIKMIVGSLDVASDLSVALDALFRMGSKDEAAQLETGLKSLVFLGKSFLGSNQDPQMQIVNQLLDQFKISSQTTDVSLSLSLPRALIDKLAAPEKKTGPEASAKLPGRRP